jgi:hypothetical protein
MKSTDKIIAFLEKYTREEFFQKRIKMIREEMGIPLSGDSLPDNFKKSLDYISIILGITYNGKILLNLPKKDLIPLNEIYLKIPSPFCTHQMIRFINIYIQYNKKLYCVFEDNLSSANQNVALFDFRNEFLEMEGCCDCKLKVAEDFMEHISLKYPVEIGISPYATQNEVISLIKERWSEISDIMKTYIDDGSVPFNKDDNEFLKTLRRRGELDLKIEDIIYENKILPLKEIGKIIKKKTGKFLDQGEIGKIKSLAIKRRGI